MAEFEVPPSRPPPDRRGSDTSIEGLFKTIGVCCVTLIVWPCALIFLLVGSTAFYFNAISAISFLALGIVCAVIGYYGCKASWEMMQ